MSKAIDYDLKTSAHEVQRLMGQCILRLQVYELLLKSVVTAHEISSPIATLATAQTDRADEIRCNTLGMLIRQMLGSLLVPQGQEGKGQPRNDAPSVTVRMQIIRNRPVGTTFCRMGFRFKPLSLLTSLTTSFAMGMICAKRL